MNSWWDIMKLIIVSAILLGVAHSLSQYWNNIQSNTFHHLENVKLEKYKSLITEIDTKMQFMYPSPTIPEVTEKIQDDLPLTATPPPNEFIPPPPLLNKNDIEFE